jgi:hypothetical protein
MKSPKRSATKRPPKASGALRGCNRTRTKATATAPTESSSTMRVESRPQ